MKAKHLTALLAALIVSGAAAIFSAASVHANDLPNLDGKE